MKKRSLVRLTALANVLGLIGVQLRIQAVQQIAGGRTDQCTNARNLDYSAGAVMLEGDQRYQCVWVYGRDLAPSGVAWVKLMEIGPKTIYTIKEPAGR